MVGAGLDGEAVARMIHRCGSPPSAPFVTVDCRQGDARSAEAGLFGLVIKPRAGRPNGPVTVAPGAAVLAADGGTLYLANVTDLPSAAQAPLARVVRDGDVRVRGSSRSIRLDLRIVAGCSETVDAEVAQGGFRVDLYRRLAAVRVDVPPLGARPADIPAVARAVLAQMRGRHDGAAHGLTKAAQAFLAALAWPGNVRELRDVLESAAALASPGPVRVEDLLVQLGGSWRRTRPVGAGLREARRQFEREYVAAVLAEYGWRMSEAARALGIQRTNLYRKIRQLDIPIPKGRSR